MARGRSGPFGDGTHAALIHELVTGSVPAPVSQQLAFTCPVGIAVMRTNELTGTSRDQ